MAAFSGSLNTNLFYNSLFNAYKLIETIADNLDGLDGGFASRYKVDVGNYNDKRVYTDMDILSSRVWDPTDTNVLAPEEKVAPVQQEIVQDQKRQIGLYSENYLTKFAWMDEGAYSAFNSVVQKTVGDTKKLFEDRLVKVYVGTMLAGSGTESSNIDSQNVKVVIAADTSTAECDKEAYERRFASKIGKTIADIFVKVGDSTRDFNDNGFMKAFKKDQFDIIWNADYVNRFDYVSLPTVFHESGIIPKFGDILPARYFGTVVTSKVAQSANLGSHYSLIEAYYGTAVTLNSEITKVYPGDAIPSGTCVVTAPQGTLAKKTNGKYKVVNTTGISIAANTDAIAANTSYTLDTTVVCKIIHKDAIKYCSNFETETEFWNSKNLSTNRYLTWFYGNPVKLDAYPLITLRHKTS